MKITLEKAMDALSEFLTEQVHTIKDIAKHSAGLFIVGALRKNPEGIMSKIAPWLEMSGILADGMVDVDVFKAGVDNIFANVPKVSYLGFGIDANEASNLVAKMMSKASHSATTTTTTTTTEAEA